MSKVFYTSNTLSVSLQKSVQSGHWYRKFRDSKQRNSTRKSYIKIPLLMKDQSCTRDCSKQTSIRALMENISLISRKKTVIHQPRLVRIGKNCAIYLNYRCSRPWAQYYPIQTFQPVNNILITDLYKKHTPGHTKIKVLRCVMFKTTCIHGKISRAVCSTTYARLKVHSSLTRTS